MFASNALEAGANPRTIMQMCGHTSPEFTMRLYMHSSQRLAQEAAEKLDAFYGGVGG